MVLVRERAGRLQVYLLRRSLQSGFMGGYYVFPGGTVADNDRDADFWRSNWTGKICVLACSHPVSLFRDCGTIRGCGNLLVKKQ